MPNELLTSAPVLPVEQAMDRCPHCGAETLRLVEERPHPLYGALGVMDRTWECVSPSCGKRVQD
jgi:hypothetical protein